MVGGTVHLLCCNNLQICLQILLSAIQYFISSRQTVDMTHARTRMLFRAENLRGELSYC
jgi:hypothetical protein